ncbi:MAG: sulfotransferase family protein [Ginsengibacter sp.]
MDQYFKDIYCIVGYERSGTTMLRNILNNSSQLNVHLIEPHYILEMYKIFGLKVKDIPGAINFLYNHKKYAQPGTDTHKAAKERLDLASLQSLYHALNEIPLGEFFLKFYYRLYSGNLKDKLLLKHPDFALHLNTLQKIFPGVKVINMVRDPRAAISSSVARWPSKSFTYRCHQWNKSISLPKNWAAKNPAHYREVIYENLLSGFKETLGIICQYMEVQVEDQMVNFHYRQGQWSVNNEPKEKEFKGVDKTKISAWKKSLSERQVTLIEKGCKKWMLEYHYPFSENNSGFKSYFFILNDQMKYAWEFSKIKARQEIIDRVRMY